MRLPCVVGEEGKQFLISEVENENDITLEELRQNYLGFNS
jgi:hypothetical protein